MSVIAGIDYGTVRIGIAVSDPGRKLAFPLEIYTRRTPEHEAAYFQKLVREEQIVLFVVGLPAHLDGRISEKAREAMAFADWLSGATGVPVEFVDERFTSREAENLMLATDMSRKKRKARRDSIAAQILLTTYLESGGIDPDQVRGLEFF